MVGNFFTNPALSESSVMKPVDSVSPAEPVPEQAQQFRSQVGHISRTRFACRCRNIFGFTSYIWEKKPLRDLITIFTPSFADEDNTNAQNLTVKEIVSRLPEDRFRVVMICGGTPDPRIGMRKNTKLLPYYKHGNTFHLLRHCLLPVPDIYFFPRTGPLDRVFFDVKKYASIRSVLITYIVMAMNPKTGGGMIGRSIRESERIFANSKYVAESVRQMFGAEAPVVYDGVDRRFYFASADNGIVQDQNESPTVLYAGSLQARKRVELVVEQAVRLPNVQFRVAGKGETETRCREMAERHGCRNVTFLGHINSSCLGQEMRLAHVFLFPSVLEGNPQVLLQAAACGLPSVAMSNYRSDYVVHGRTGFLVDSDIELSHALDRLIAEPTLRRNFSAAALRYVEQFDWDRIAKQWAAIFENAVAPGAGRPRESVIL
jgi:glycosyltransferase involved in cell wall biosynthesis